MSGTTLWTIGLGLGLVALVGIVVLMRLLVGRLRRLDEAIGAIHQASEQISANVASGASAADPPPSGGDEDAAHGHRP